MPLNRASIDWNKIKNKPSTVGGFGISDMASQTVANAATVTNLTATQVKNVIAALGAGDVGTFAYLSQNTSTSTTIIAGNNYAGSGLVYSSGNSGNGVTVSGTWKAVGTSTVSTLVTRATVFMRIA